MSVANTGGAVKTLVHYSTVGLDSDSVTQHFWLNSLNLLGFVPQPNLRAWSQGKQLDFNRNLTDHWNRHKNEFPEFKSQNDYYRFAIDFMQNPPSGTLRKNRRNGDVLMYNPKDNTFMSIDKDGSIRTMFRPNDGIEYWNRQK